MTITKPYITTIIVVLFSTMTIVFCNLNAIIEYSHAKLCNIHYLSLDDGNQDSLLIGSRVKSSTIDRISSHYDWNNYTSFDNPVFDYQRVFLDDFLDIGPGGYIFYPNAWENFNREQKVFVSFILFSHYLETK